MVIEGAIASLLVEVGTNAASKAYDWYDDRERSSRISENLNDLETEFNDRLGKRIQERANDDDIDSTSLLQVGWKWKNVADRVDVYELSFEDEREAVDEITERIVETVNADTDTFGGTELDESDEQELHDILSDEFAEATEQFRETVEGNQKLQDKLQNDLNVQILEELREMQESFARLNATPYDVYDFPEERDKILEKLDKTFIKEDEAPEFIERNDGTVPDDHKPAKHFVVGPSGSGKSRIVFERLKRLSDDSLAHIMVPDKGMLSPSDASGLARESFDGDLLLVWGDVHRVALDQENAFVKDVLTKLDDALTEQGHSLHTLLEARSDKLDSLTGNLPDDFNNEFSKSIWTEYEPIWTEELDEAVLYRMVGAMAEKYGVEMDEEARDALVEKTNDSKSAPEYIDAALSTVHDEDGELTVEDVEELSETVEEMWQENYDYLRDESPKEWNILLSMKALYDLNVLPYSRLVRCLYLEVFNGDRGVFKPAVKSLSDGRRWVNVVREGNSADEVLEDEVRYEIHDTQLDAVSYSAKDDADEVSELLLDETADAVPQEIQARVHFFVGKSLHEWEVAKKAAVHYERSIAIEPNTIAYNNYGILLHKKLDRPEDAEKKYKKAIKHDPEYAIAYNNYGLLLYEKLDRPEDAEKKYKKAIKHDPEHAIAYYNYGNLLARELDRPEDAEKKYKKAIKHDPEYAIAYTNYGSLLDEKLDRPEDAEKKYKKAIKHDPEYADAYNNYGNLLYEKLDRPEDAEKKYKKAIKHDPEYAIAYNNYGNLLYEKLDRPEDAEKKYKKAIKHDPEHANAYNNYGSLLHKKLDRPEDAEKKYKKAIKHDPEYAIAYNNYGNLLYEKLDRPEDAEKKYKKAIKHDPEHAEPYNNYGNLLDEKLDRPEDAEKKFKKAIKHDPEHANAYNNYGILLDEKLDRPEDAEKKFKKAIKHDPEYAIAYNNYGLLLHKKLDRPEDAEKKYKKAIKHDPEYADAYNNYGNLLYEKLDRPEDAEKKYKKAIKHDPENADAYNNYGSLLDEKLDRPEDAEKKYKKAIKHDPEHANAYYNYGNLLYEKLDRPEDAEKKYKKAIKHDPEYADAYNNYGNLLYEKLDRPEDAEKKFKKAIKHDPEYANAYNNYGSLLRKKLDRPEDAEKKFKKAINLFRQKGKTQHLLVSLRGLVSLSMELGQWETVTENCELALEVLEEAPQLDPDGSERLWFKSMRVLSKEDTIEIYRHGLENVEASQGNMAFRLFEHAWERRDEHVDGSQSYSAAVSAGVALAAHLDMGVKSSRTVDGIIAEIDADDLSGSQKAVYDEVHPDRETDVTPKGIFESAEQYESLGLDGAAFEARVFGKILGALKS
ncbi:tetratricopeptide repeat protein [Halorutilales archaeon Cl-col2-1]